MRSLFWTLGLLGIANALWMLTGPHGWYEGLPAGIPDTGPFNAHFVRDVGAAYATFGIALCFAAEQPRLRQSAAAITALFYGLHALIHVADLLAGRLDAKHWLIDTPGVFLPALFLVWLAMPGRYQEAARATEARRV